MNRRNWRHLLVLLGVLTIGVLTGCGENDEGAGDGSTDSIVSADADEPADGEAEGGETTSTSELVVEEAATADLELSDDPTQWVRQVLLPADSFPAGYTVEDTTETSSPTACLERASTVVEHPPVAFATDDISGENSLSQLVARYESEADAAVAFSYFQSLEELCNETWLSDQENDFTTMYVEPLTPAPIDGVDRLTASSRQIHGADAVFYLDVYGAQVGDSLLLALSTDPDSAESLISALAQRAQGTDVSEPIVPAAPMETTPGYRSTEYWSWPGEGPALIRQSLETPTATQFLEEASVTWLNEASDERIDALAGDACVVSHDLTENDNLDLAVISVYTADEVAAGDPLILGQVFGYVAGVYCPFLAEKLVTMVEG